MNDKFTNEKRDDELIAQKLNQVARQTHANSQFAAELEEKLRSAHRPKSHWLATFDEVPPVLRWVALMAVLALVLSWSIRSLVPAPQPANENTTETPILLTATPAPNVLPDESATPATQQSGHDFRGAKLFLEQPLPESPQTAHVYEMNDDEPTNLEQAHALAAQFGIQGEMYAAPGYIFDTNDYLITDGKQSLHVHSDKYFTYTADIENSHRAYLLPANPDAETIIREFLIAHGFDFPFQVYASDFFVGYIVQPLAPDSIPMQYESFTTPMMRVVLDENGQVLVIDSSLMSYDSNAIGEYGIITAQEAFDRLLDDSIVTGKLEFTHAPTSMPKEWYRSYPDNQRVTVHGYITTYLSLEADKPPLLLMNGVSLIGNTSGMENLENSSFISVTGQFSMENAVRRFIVESWDRNVNEAWISGVLSQQGDQVIITSDDGSGQQYTIADPPADLPIGSQPPGSSLGISGVVMNDMLSWYYIQFFEGSSSGGGGGGNAFGFYKLNLTGVPIPFPASPTPRPDSNAGTYVVKQNDTLASIASNFGVRVDALMQANNRVENIVYTGEVLVIPSPQMAPNNSFTGIYPIQEGDTLTSIADRFGTTVDTLMHLNSMADSNIYVGQPLRVPMPEPQEQQVQDLRGYLSITLHITADGTSSKEYGLDVTHENGSTLYTMEGPILSELADGQNGLPLLVTGTINTEGKLIVDSYKIPYPNLQFQILKGTQRAAQLEGQNVILFTTDDGQSYVEFLATNPMPLDSFLTGIEGDRVEIEVLIIPDETFGGMPVAHVYQSALFQENGSAMEVQANRIIVYDESNGPQAPSEFTQPNLTINKVELVYFASNPYYQVNGPNYEQRTQYIQPVWHFQGRYEDGREFDILIQALEQEFLLPELVPHGGIG
jgi:LysM repeat protein